MTPNDHLVNPVTQPIVDLCGVVGRKGIMDYTPSQNSGKIGFALEAWKLPSGEINRKWLFVQTNHNQSGLDLVTNLVEGFAVLYIRARLINPGEALLEEIVGVLEEDESLNKIAAEMWLPSEFCDEQLGLFSDEERDDNFSAVVPWKGVPVPISLNIIRAYDNAVGMVEELTEAANILRILFADQESWDEQIRTFASQELLNKANIYRRAGKKAEFTEKTLAKAWRLGGIDSAANSGFHFSFEGDLFRGQKFSVRGDIENGPEHITWIGTGRNEEIEKIELDDAKRNSKFLDLSYLSIEGLPFVSEMTRVEHLNLYACELLQDLNRLQYLKRLRVLNIGKTSPLAGWDVLGKLQNLHHLNLSYCSLRNCGFLEGLVQLQELSLANCRINRGLQTLKNLIHLRSINLWNVRDSVIDEAITVILDLPELNYLVTKHFGQIPRALLSMSPNDNCLARIKLFLTSNEGI